MRMRKAYGERRIRLQKSLKRLLTSSVRKEMKRKGKNTSLKLMRRRIVGAFRKEEEEDLRRLGGVSENRGDLIEALACLQEATVFINIMIRHPVMMGTPRYRNWSIELDKFLSDMRSLVDYRKMPGQHDSEVEETLVMRLKAMRIHEDSAAQKEVRYKLEDAMQRLFEPRSPEKKEIRKRLLGQ